MARNRPYYGNSNGHPQHDAPNPALHQEHDLQDGNHTSNGYPHNYAPDPGLYQAHSHQDRHYTPNDHPEYNALTPALYQQQGHQRGMDTPRPTHNQLYSQPDAQYTGESMTNGYSNMPPAMQQRQSFSQGQFNLDIPKLSARL
ncbi:hypothetical protein FQN54_005152 [Arachnomyces sp. PD_36]|nr:hypothetical protein FQN54_005152 [Arachnomyces sp. PD_36]